MLQLSNPSQLFNQQKIFSLNADVEKIFHKGIELKQGKEIIILYRFDADEFIKGDERVQLLKILSACKLKEEDVVVINTAVAENISLSWLRNNFPVNTLIVFGEIKLTNNLQFKKHIAYNIDGIQIVYSEPITKLLSSANDKKALWIELKKIFKVA